MVKLAVGLLVALTGAVGAATGAETRVFNGSIDGAADVDTFRFCAVGGQSIELSVKGAAAGEPVPFTANLALLDEHGAAIPSLTHAWRAPYSGQFFARVSADASQSAGAYEVKVALDGGGETVEPINLSVSQSRTPEPVDAGELLTYTINLANTGPGVANETTLLDSIPVGTTFVSGSWTEPRENWECTFPAVGTNGKVGCTNKCFEAGGRVTFTIVVAVDICVGDRPLSNVVTVAASGVEIDPSDNVTVLGSTVFDPRTCDDGNVCTVGDGCAPGTALQEDFDSVAPRSWPPGWRATILTAPPGVSLGWRTGTGTADTEPIAAFAPDAPDIRDVVLDSPPIRILTPSAKVIFRNRYDLERNQDGGVFEMRIGNGPFFDILTFGGHFEAGGYTGTIRRELQSPIGGRDAWTGSSGGFIETIVALPPAAAGQDVVLRWRLATDFAQGSVGQFIDSIVVTGPDVCRSGAVDPCDDGQLCTTDTCDTLAGCRHTALTCDDGNPCTADTCDPGAQCLHAFVTAPCDDHNPCTQTDSCSLGTCVGANPLACTPTDACGTAACDPEAGCRMATSNLDSSGFSAARVDGRDVAVLAAAWNSCLGEPRYNPAADLDIASRCIDTSDFHLFMDAFGRSCTP